MGSKENLGGPFSWPASVSSASVSDGLSHTAAYCEKLRGEVGRRRLDPRVDLLINPGYTPSDPARPLVDCAFQTPDPGHYYTTVGTNWFVGALSQTCYNHLDAPNSVEPDCMIPKDNPVIGRASARSNHPSGVNVAMADGSVRFIGQAIDLNAWKALGTRAGGEVGDPF